MCYSARFLRVFLPLALMTLLSGCIEIQMRLSIRHDGSALVELGYAVYRRFLLGDLVEIEKNELIPLAEAEVQPWLKRIAGSKLIDYSERDVDDSKYARVGGLRLYRLMFSIEDLNDLRFDHIRFAWYPWNDEQIFQFRVVKDLSVITPAETTADPLADAVLGERTLRLKVEFPARLRGGNAEQLAWGQAEWTFPVRTLYSSLHPTVVAWARTAPVVPRWQGYLAPFWYGFMGEDWRDPEGLPRGRTWEEPPPPPAALPAPAESTAPAAP